MGQLGVDTEYYVSEGVGIEVHALLVKGQKEHPSGLWYIEPYTLQRVARLLGGEYSGLSKAQKQRFRGDCIENVMSARSMNNYKYYKQFD